MNESREWIFHPLSTWPVLCNGGGLFRWQVGHISVAYFFFSCHQYLFLLLFYRIAVSWLSCSVSEWSLGQHVCRFSLAITHLSSFWGFGNPLIGPEGRRYFTILPANPGGIVGSFIQKLLCCLWMSKNRHFQTIFLLKLALLLALAREKWILLFRQKIWRENQASQPGKPLK